MDERVGTYANGIPVSEIHLNGHKRNTTIERSEMMQEIVSGKSDFLERWGLLFFLGFLVIAFSCTWFVRYPDTIEAGAFLTATNAPKEIISRQDGRLVRLFARNDDAVKAGQVIGWIESTANHEEVLLLEEQLDSCAYFLSAGRSKEVARLFRHHYQNLGELQGRYQQFINSWQQFNDYMVNGFYIHKKELLQNDIQTLRKMNQTLLQQQNILEKDLQLAEETYKMNELLAKDKVIAQSELRSENSKYLNKQITIPQLNTSILSNDNQQRDKEREVNQIDLDFSKQQMIFQQALQILKSEVDDWDRKYVLRSALDGKVSFTTLLQERQFVPQGRILGFVNPSGNEFYVQTNLQQYNFGKIDTGMQVKLLFDAYPYQEFGTVEGSLSYVSRIATDSGFLATIRLNQGLQTNHKTIIPYKNGLRARAIIITQNIRLLQRFYYSIVKATSQNK